MTFRGSEKVINRSEKNIPNSHICLFIETNEGLTVTKSRAGSSSSDSPMS